VIDYILDKNQFTLDKQKFKGAYTIERLNGDKVLFIKGPTASPDKFIIVIGSINSTLSPFKRSIV
jgi:hypothetical protein